VKRQEFSAVQLLPRFSLSLTVLGSCGGLANSHRAESEAVNCSGSGISSQAAHHSASRNIAALRVYRQSCAGILDRFDFRKDKENVENVLQTLFSILQTARRFGSAVRADSRADIVLPHGGISREVRFFDAEQVGKIVAAAKEPYSAMFAVLE
jgi:hypothetical protein